MTYYNVLQQYTTTDSMHMPVCRANTIQLLYCSNYIQLHSNTTQLMYYLFDTTYCTIYMLYYIYVVLILHICIIYTSQLQFVHKLQYYTPAKLRDWYYSRPPDDSPPSPFPPPA